MNKDLLLSNIKFVESVDGLIPAGAVAKFARIALDECIEAVNDDRDPDYTTALTCINFEARKDIANASK